MGILTDINKIKANIASDISLEMFLNSINVNFLTGKAVEALVEKGSDSKLEEFESILNAMYLLIAELEENHAHEKERWCNSEIMRYVANLNKDNGVKE